MSLPKPVAGLELLPEGPLIDRFGRRHTYVRVSVTDRCNYRCTYCMPAEGVEGMPRSAVLSFEEIVRIVRVMASMGVRRVRLTGGEPTVRRGLVGLVRALAAIEGIDDLSMTTNGHLFSDHAEALAAAGLRRVNVSLDTLDPARFAAITRGGDVHRVLASIAEARRLGLKPLKINCVVVGGSTDDDVLPLVEYFAPHAADTVVRFIEFMPFGPGSRRQHVPVGQIRARIARRYTLEPIAGAVADHGDQGGPSRDWQVAETGQRIGFISPITEHFCDTCNRLRLQADGHLRTCLSRDGTPSLRDLLRGEATDAQLGWELRKMVWGKVAGHEAHLDDFRAFEGVMTHIGG